MFSSSSFSRSSNRGRGQGTPSSLFDQFDEPDSWQERYSCLFRWAIIITLVSLQIGTLFSVVTKPFKPTTHIFLYFVFQSLINGLICFVALLSYIRIHRGDGRLYKIPSQWLGISLVLLQAYGGYGLLTLESQDEYTSILIMAVFSVLVYTLVGIIQIIESIRSSDAQVDRRLYTLAATQDFELHDLDDGMYPRDDDVYIDDDYDYDVDMDTNVDLEMGKNTFQNGHGAPLSASASASKSFHSSNISQHKKKSKKGLSVQFSDQDTTKSTSSNPNSNSASLKAQQ